MKTIRIELLLISGLILSMVLSLLNYTWIKPVLFIGLTGLIGFWIFGYLKRDKLDINGFDKSEITERLLSIVLILGLFISLTDISFSNLTISFGLLILIIFLSFKGVKKLMRKEIFTGIELIIISIIFLGYLMSLRHFVGGNFIKAAFMTLLSIFYLAMSIYFIITSIKSNKKTIGVAGMMLYWSLNAFVLALLFDTFFWPGEMSIYWIGFTSSLIVLPILIIQTLKNKNLPKELGLKDLYKRFVILVSLSLFFAIASPKQQLRISFGNRPQLINAYYDCRLNSKLNDFSKEQACQEFQLLNNILIFGYYNEGLREENLDELKQEFGGN